MVAKAKEQEKALFPGIEVALLSGKHVVVRPWGLEQGRFMIDRIAALVVKMRSDVATPDELMTVAFDETKAIVQDTIEYSDAQMSELAFEDMIDLTQAVMDTCLIRPDGGGILGKVIKLLDRGTAIANQMTTAATSQLQSSISSRTATRSQT